MRPRQKAAKSDTGTSTVPVSPVLHSRFDRSATFSEKDVAALPAFADLVRTVESINAHHLRAASSRDFFG